MKQLAFFLFLFSFSTIYSQDTELVDLAQLFLGIEGVDSSEVIYHTIEAAGAVWEQSGSTYIISDDESIYNSTMYSTGNFSTSNYNTWALFNWVWRSQIGRVSPCGLGLYKITNSKVSGKYFYLDTRDNEYVESGVNPDVWFVYDVNEGKYFCYVKCGTPPPPIENAELVRVSDILGYTAKTDKLENYWNNALAILTDQNNPRIVWGPHPTFQATNYKVYRAVSSNPLAHPELYASVIATVSSSTYEYKDIDIASGPAYIYYFVKGYNGSYSNRTNIEQVNGGFYKENLTGNGRQIFTFDLEQNYPNPFNPSTTISFSVAENSFITLKVYDVLGNEIAELVNEAKEPGSYSVSFDASNLSSGIYFYTLQANNQSITRKLIFAK